MNKFTAETVYFFGKGALLLAVAPIPGADTFACLFAGILSIVASAAFAFEGR